MDELRVVKERVEATVTLSNGTTTRGHVFVSAFSATHTGPEGIRDVLNAEPGFIPFELIEPGGPRTVLYNPKHVVMARLASDQELRDDPAYDLATKRTVSMLLSNGERLRGLVRIARPLGRDRLSDHARWSEPFWYLEAPTATLIVNASHVIELMELND